MQQYKERAHKAADLTAKQLELDEMMKKNDTWKGALTKADGFVEGFDWPLDDQPKFLEQVGGYPWLCVVRKYAFRYGPAAMPLPGVGCFFVPLTGPLMVTCMKAEGLVGAQINMREAPAFLETPVSKAYKEQGMQTFVVEQNTALWVPFGVLAVPVLTNEDQDTSQAWVLSYFAKELAMALPESVWKGILTFNREQFVRHEGKQLWKARCATFECFAKEVGITV